MTESLPAEPLPPQVPVVALWSRVMADVRVIRKTRRHDGPSAFLFRGIEDVQAALHPVLVRHGVLVVPEEVVERRDLPGRTTAAGKTLNAVALHVRFRVWGPMGDSFPLAAWGEGADSGDKATGKAHSMAYKSALLEALNVPTEDQDDADRTDPTADRPETDEQREELDDLARRAVVAAREATTSDALQDVGAYAYRRGVIDRRVQVEDSAPGTVREALEFHAARLATAQQDGDQGDGHPESGAPMGDDGSAPGSEQG